MRLRNLTIALAGTMLSATAFAATSGVGVVNIQQVFTTVPQGHASLLKIKSQMAPKISSLKAEQASIEAAVKSVEKNAPTMSKAAKEAKEKSLVAKQHAFQNKVMGLRASEMKLEKTAAATFSADLKSACKSVATKGGYSVILTSQAAPYSSSSVDVTSKVEADMKSLKS